MRRNRGALTLGVAVLVAALLGAAPALGHARAPRALYSPGDLVVRPPFMVFPLFLHAQGTDYFFGPGETVADALRGHYVKLHWRRWAATAVARGTFLGAKCSERQGRLFDCSTTRYERSRSVLTLYRVRHGLYTRLRMRILGLPGNEGTTMPYELREVRGAGGPGGRRGLRWCAVTETRVCLAP